jgi:DNA polymerase-3 subunit gamma/tau
LSVLDQLIAGAGVYGVTYARAVALLGVTDVALIDEMIDALAAGDGGAAFATIDRVADAGHEARRFTSDLLERLRDLIVLQRVPDAAASGIIDAPEDQLERMTAQAARMGQATLSRMADIAHNGLTEMRGTTAPRLLLELIAARMLLPGADDSQGALLQRLERMERRLAVSAEPAETAAVQEAPPTLDEVPLVRASEPGAAKQPATQAVPASPPPAPASAAMVGPESHRPAVAAGGTFVPPSSTVESSPPRPAPLGALDAAAVRRVWDEILTTVRRRRPKAWAVVREAVVRDVQGDEIVLVFQHAVHANMFGAEAELLLEALREVLGGTWRVRAELGGDERTGNHPPAVAAQAGPAAPARPAPAPSTDTDGWPETTRPGAGSPPADPVPAAQGQPSSSAAAPTRGSGARAAASTRPVASTRGAAGRGTTTRGGKAAAPGTARKSGAESAPDEPPSDPDYDRARPGVQPHYAGFDPGDEPLDDAGPAIRESSEEQAIRAVTEHFAIERIGEINPRA